jgi:hypothetical protein
MTKELAFSPNNTRFRKSNRSLLAYDRASRITKICNRILEIVENPEADLDVVESILVTYSELESRLEKIQERNGYKNTKIIRHRKKKELPVAAMLK